MGKTWPILLFFCGSIIISSCTPIEKIPLTEDLLLIEMERGPSRGRYPIYKVAIYNNQVMEYQGKRYTPKLGTWVRELNDQEWKDLNTQLKRTNIWQFKEFFRSQSYDLPLVTITQYDDGASKSVSGKDTRPPEVLILERLLESFSLKEGWVEKEPFDFGLPKNVLPNQLRIELRPGTYIHNWLYKYSQQNMQMLAELPDKSNFWLVSYDPTITFPKEMEQLLSYDREVVKFEFNTTEK